MTTFESSETVFNMTSMKIRGMSLPFKEFDDINYRFWSTVPDDMYKHLQFVKEFEVRSDDVFVCTYPKSGTNWIHEIVHMLLHGKSDYGPLFSVIEQTDIETVNKMESPRLYVSHLPIWYLPAQLTETGRIICVVRNPKDVTVSLHNHLLNMNFGTSGYEGSFADFLPLFLDGELAGGSWFDHVMNWEKVPKDYPNCSLLTVHYEDMKRDMRPEVEKISSFLDLDNNERLISEIVTKCDFPNLSKEKRNNVPEIQKKLTKNVPNSFYRKGIVGDWKNWFTIAQNEHFDSIYKEKMKKSHLSFTFTL